MSEVSASSSARVRNVNEKGGGETGYWPPIPGSGDSARLHYDVRVNEVSPAQPSVGFVSAYLDLSIAEGGSFCPGGRLPFEQVAAKERRSVDGNVTMFTYDVDYISGMKR